MKILNLAAGKLLPLDLPMYYLLVQLDTMYYDYMDPARIEQISSKYRDNTLDVVRMRCNEDAFTFMERTSIQFDRICAYRFLEHIPMDKVLYFIYLISTCLKVEGVADIIVPDYRKLARLLLEDKTSDEDFESKNILLTTELLNEPSCPHASIWTQDRLLHFFANIEERFHLIKCWKDYEFDGRNIYLRALFKRIK